MPTSPLFEEGLKLFNARRYYDAHEVWEDLWRETDGPLRKFYQGLIHAAVALHHLQRQNIVGARSQLGKSIQKLRAYAADCCGIDNAGMIEQLEEVLESLKLDAVQIRRITEKG